MLMKVGPVVIYKKPIVLQNTSKYISTQRWKNPLNWEEPVQENLATEPTAFKEIPEVIHFEINPKKAPEFDLIIGKILKQLPKNAFGKLSHLDNVSFKLK